MSLRFKTVIGVALIEALLLAFLIFTVVSYMRNSAGEALLKRAKTTATLFATTTKDPVLSFDLASLESFSEELLANPDLEYVRVKDAAGRIFSSSGNQSLLDRPFREDTLLDDVDDGVFDSSALISESGIVYGRVELGINTESIETVILESRKLSVAIAVVEMALVALFSFLLGTYLTRQLKVLRHSAKRLSQGDYTVQIPIKTKDEVAEVAMAFNQMTTALCESEISRDEKDAELIQLNRTLEDRVERRTAKISKQIIALKLANKRIADTQAKLIQSEKLASVGQLAAGVAHEINNPIGFVRSNLNTLSDYIGVYQNLLQRYQDLTTSHGSDLDVKKSEIQELEKKENLNFINEDISELVSDSIEGTTRVRDIVQGLNNFSHVNVSGKADCDINECISSTLKIVNNELKYKCEVVTDFNTVPKVHGNVGELNQVLMNLLVNAGHAIECGGTISINTEEVDDRVKISVNDNGKGIKKEDIDKLFDPFFTTKPVGEGTGLGLSISFGIIQDHRGEISVESELGVGTTFCVVLPSSPEDQLTEAA